MVDRPGKNRRNIGLFICADTTTLRLFDVEIPEKWNLSSLHSIAALLGELLCGFFIVVLWLVVHRACGVSLGDGLTLSAYSPSSVFYGDSYCSLRVQVFPRLRLLPHPEVRKRP